jgi:cell wall-associated NlpC family hydrolase
MSIRSRLPYDAALPATSPRSPLRLMGVVVLALAVLLTLVTPAGARTTEAPPPPAAPASAGEALTVRRTLMTEVRQTRDVWQTTVEARDAEAQALGEAGDALRTARDNYDQTRATMAGVAAALYMRSGGADDAFEQASDLSAHQRLVHARVGTGLIVSAAADKVRAAVEVQRLAQARFDQADEVMDAARADYDDALDKVRSADAALQRFLDDAQVDFSPVAYDAYISAQEIASYLAPDCRLPAAVVASIGRAESNHGRDPDPFGLPAAAIYGPALDGYFFAAVADSDGGLVDGDPTVDRAVGPMQMIPSTWLAHAADGNGDGVKDPQNIYDATLSAAGLLCSYGDLSQWETLAKAVHGYNHDDEYVRVVTAGARRYAAASGLDMGVVPFEPAPANPTSSPMFASNPQLASRDIASMIEYSLTLIGTPYSQCLGPDVRPQDPICPPGTNRFGAGFFDCSGFVSALYRTIGVSIATTTYLMGSDPALMATQVAASADVSVMQPGDLLLMDGHVAMYVADGQIIHARSGGVTLERLPVWVAAGTYAVLRPSLL